MTMMNINNLGKTYSENLTTSLKTNSQRKMEDSDRMALRKVKDIKRKQKEIEESLDEEKRIIVAKGKVNHVARKHNLIEPDTNEALKHDRYHCYICARLLDKPDAYKELDENIQPLFGDDKDVRTVCCFCFGDIEIGKEIVPSNMSTKNIRMLVYNPVGAVKLGLDKIEEIERKIRRYPSSVKLVGKIRHNTLEDVDRLEFSVQENAKTRWTACTL